MINSEVTKHQRKLMIHQIGDLVLNFIIDQDERMSSIETLLQSVMEAPLANKLYTMREAATYLRINADSLRKARRRGTIQAVRINEKQWGFYQSELDSYLTRHNRKR